MDQNKFLEVIFEAAVENGVNLFLVIQKSC